VDFLSKRQIALLGLLVKEDKFIPSNYYAEQLNVSSRTLYSDIKKSNILLKKYGLCINKKTHFGIYLSGDIDDKSKFLKDFYMNNAYKYEYSPEQRQIILGKRILLNGEVVSYQDLADEFFVSKTSIHKDLLTIQAVIGHNGFEFLSDHKGTRIIGSESCIQEAIKKFVCIYLPNDDCSKLAHLECFFYAEVISLAVTICQNMEINSNIKILEHYYQPFIITMLVLITRIEKNHHIEKRNCFLFEEVKNMGTYAIASDIVRQTQDRLKINFNKSDIDFLNRQLIAHGFQNILHDHLNTNRKYIKIVQDIIAKMSIAMKVDLNNDKKLFKNILAHIVTMIYRLENRMYIQNPLLGEMKKQYSICFSATWYVMSSLERIMKITLTEDEVSFLMIHFLVAIERHINVHHIVIVCSNVYNSTEFIANKITQLLPVQDVVEIVPSRKIYKNNLENIDLIISAVPLNPEVLQNINSKPILQISPLLTVDDMKNISNFYANTFFNKFSISKDIKNFAYLKNIIDNRLIFYQENLNDKENCLNKMISAVEESGCVSKDFRKAIFEREDAGTTALDSGVAMPHAPPYTVVESKLVIMTLKNNIKWDDKKINVILMVCISEKDVYNVKNIFSEVYEMVGTKEKAEQYFFHQTDAGIYKLLRGGKI
jgi:activator of the mannose operon, transcriptional antiterminator